MQKIKASRKWKLLKESIKKNFYLDRYIFKDLLILTFTSLYLISHIPDAIHLYDYIKCNINDYIEEKEFDVLEYEESLKGTITCSDMRIKVETGYEVKDGILYKTNGEKVDLTNETNPLYLAKIGISNDTLKEMNLNKSNIEEISFNYIAITDEFTNYLPSSLKYLSISRCDYITNLNGLEQICPNLEELSIEKVTSLDSFAFIYNLSNLKTLNIKESYGITDELLEYCKKKGINVISNGNEIENTKVIKAIANEIIDASMTDEEKIASICKYVINNIEYDMNLSDNSNAYPITCALDKEGVCISYAYLTSALFKEAGITSNRVNTKNHVWNLVEINGDYFYIDNTHIDSRKSVRELFNLFGISPSYMNDPNQNLFLSSKNISADSVNIPPELKRDILALEDEKTLIEKYGSTVGISTIYLLEIALYALFWLGICESTSIILNFFFDLSCTKATYKELKLEELHKNKH